MMTTLKSLIARSLPHFVADEKAAVSIEYAVIAASVGAILVGTLTMMGTSVTGMLESVKSAWPG